MVNLILIGVCFFMFAYNCYRWQNSNQAVIVVAVDFLYPILLMISMIALASLYTMCLFRHVVSNGLIFMSWLMFTVGGVIEFVHSCMAVHNRTDGNLIKIAFIIYWSLLLFELILHCFADVRDVAHSRQCPEYHCSFLCRITFWWFIKLAVLGWRKTLVHNDLWQLDFHNTSQYLDPIWEKYWSLQVERYHSNLLLAKTQSNSGSEKRKVRQPSIFLTVFFCFKRILIAGALCRLLSDTLVFAGPMILRQLIRFVADRSQPFWIGVTFAVLLFVQTEICSLFTTAHLHLMLRAAMNIRTVLSNAIFQKSLKLSNSARQDLSVGEMINLLSCDCQKFMQVAPFANLVWVAPYQIILAIVFLWTVLGPSVLAGIALMAVAVPFQAFLYRRYFVLLLKQLIFKDDRIDVTSEVLNGMKIIKLYAWESAFEIKVTKIRDNELRILKLAAILDAICNALVFITPFFVTVVTFAAYTLSSKSHVLTAEKAFVTLALFQTIKIPTMLLSGTISNLFQLHACCNRIRSFLLQDEIEQFVTKINKNEETIKEAINIDAGSFTWNSEMDSCLSGINCSIPEGRLIAVVGNVGSGKSSLINAILGEIMKTSGSVTVKGSIAYVPQQPWIFNATLRDNILFRNRWDQFRYRLTVQNCCLETDIGMFTGGDMVEIGEKGINLSGGQKQRISLARAVYFDADIYLLDDPLSAVDSHVGSKLFQDVISYKGMLKYKTRFLVTHQLSYLKHVDSIIVLDAGKIVEYGSYKRLVKQDGRFAALLKLYEKDIKNDEHAKEDLEKRESFRENNKLPRKATTAGLNSNNLPRKLTTVGFHDKKISFVPRKFTQVAPIRKHSAAIRKLTVAFSLAEDDDVVARKLTAENLANLRKKTSFMPTFGMFVENENEAVEALIKDEENVQTKISVRTLMAYFKTIGVISGLFALFLYFLMLSLSIGNALWLAKWSNAAANNSIAENNSYLGVYAAFGFVQGVVQFCLIYIFIRSAISAANKLHFNLFQNLMRSPLHFFETTPLGRIINRFSRDVEVVDTVIPYFFRLVVSFSQQITASIILAVIATPIFAAVVIPLLFVYFLFQIFYTASSRQLQKIDAIYRSPICSYFQESLQGVTSIRAYRVQERFCKKFSEIVDESSAAYYANAVSNRWSTIYLELLGAFVMFCAAIFAVVAREYGSITPGLLGLSVSYAMAIIMPLNWLIRESTEFYSNMVSVERILEYTHSPTEVNAECLILHLCPASCSTMSSSCASASSGK